VPFDEVADESVNALADHEPLGRRRNRDLATDDRRVRIR
jgi:hypothetical protein